MLSNIPVKLALSIKILTARSVTMHFKKSSIKCIKNLTSRKTFTPINTTVFHRELSNSLVFLKLKKHCLVATSAGTNVLRNHLNFTWMKYVV